MSEEFTFGGEIVWRPAREQIEQSNLYQFMTRHGFSSFEELQRHSTEDIAWFWDTVLKDLEIEFYEPYSQVVDISRGGYPFPEWCVGGKMNIVHNCLDKYIGTPKENQTALKWEGEEGATWQLTYGELYREVNRVAQGLRALGLRKGDAIGLFMPMTPEIVIALLAIAKIGGVILPLFSGYGAGAVAVRLRDADAKALFTADGTFRRGQVVPMKPIADEAVAQAPTIRHVIVLRRAGNEIAWDATRDHGWDEFAAQDEDAETERTSAEDQLMIIYTSGTTGKPKGAVHTHCGFPIKAAQDMYHGLDLHPSDTLYWMTDMGWMMGPWLVFGTLLLGGTMFLYDGAPDFPGPDRVWDMVERRAISILGVSPTFVRAIMRFGDEPVKQHSLDRLRAFGSTGEPWNPTPWLWLFNTVGGGTRPIMNYSGGTEISGGILMGNMLTPLKPGSFAGPLPGMDADVVDEHGNSVREQVGELVIRKPWIGMTRGFWRDPERYLQTYWSRFPNVWVHGDWAAVDEDGLWYILGRSDDVIKVAGKRLGPAEVESALARHPAVQESAAIGVPDEVKGESVVCFTILKPSYEPGEELKKELREILVDELGKPLAPKQIFFVKELPRTRSAKIMRRVARAVYLGQDPGDVSALENVSAVEEIRKVLEVAGVK